MSNIFDFGFTAVDEHELDAVKEVSQTATSTEERLNALYNAIVPLLNNLKKNSNLPKQPFYPTVIFMWLMVMAISISCITIIKVNCYIFLEVKERLMESF